MYFKDLIVYYISSVSYLQSEKKENYDCISPYTVEGQLRQWLF